MNFSLLRIAGFGALVLLCGLIAIASLRAGLSEEAVAQKQYPMAAAIDPDNDRALALAAEVALQAKQFDQAIGLARRAVQIAPFNVRALRVLSEALRARGKHDSAENLMALAAMGGWREAATQAWAFQRALLTNDAAVAIARGEALVRIEKKSDKILEAFRMLSLTPQGREPLVSRLGDMPSWRTEYFQLAPNVPEDQLEATASVLLDLKKTPNPPVPSEARATIAALVNAKRMDVAWKLYSGLFGERERGRRTADAGFDRPENEYRAGATATAFDWTLFDSEDGAATIERLAGAGDGTGAADPVDNPALFASINTRQPEVVVAEQVALLAPGDYVLHMRVRADQSSARRGAVWRVHCANDMSVLANTTDRFLGSEAWAIEDVPFTVPAKCNGVRLRLVGRPSPLGLTTQIWYDDVRIARPQ